MSLSDENAEQKAAQTVKDNKDIAKGAGANFLGFIIRLGSRLPFLIIAVALFGAELYGRYNYTITTIEICAAFATFGFKRSLFKFIHDKEYAGKYTLEQVMISALLCSLIVGAIFTIIVEGAGEVTVDTSGTATINGSTSFDVVIAGAASNKINAVTFSQRTASSDDWIAVGAY
mgnify:CR=1 FL=1